MVQTDRLPRLVLPAIMQAVHIMRAELQQENRRKVRRGWDLRRGGAGNAVWNKVCQSRMALS